MQPSDAQRIVPTATAQTVFAGVVFCAALASCVQATHSRGELYAPPALACDEPSYERLGYNLASGLGFGYCPNLFDLSGVPEESLRATRCEPQCEPAEFIPTAYRPPGFPFLVAAIYTFSPHNFFLVRITNCVCCAIAVMSVAVAFFRRYSWVSGLCVGVFCSFDPRFREMAGKFMTENLATLMLSLTALAMVAFLRNATPVRAGFAGISLSALAFTRTFYTVWYPVLWLTMAAILFRRCREPGFNSRSALTAFFVYAAASVAITGPWWIRNCLVLQAVMPTGTQGGIGLVDGFSDSAHENRGSWKPDVANRISDEMHADPQLRALTGIEFEKEHSRRGMALAKAWMRDHPREVAQLTGWKVLRLWEIGNPRHMILFSIALLGLIVTRDQPLTRVAILLLVLNTLTVMATYHTYERFMTPFRPLIHGLAGCGLEFVVVRTMSKFVKR